MGEDENVIRLIHSEEAWSRDRNVLWVWGETGAVKKEKNVCKPYWGLETTTQVERNHFYLNRRRNESNEQILFFSS